MKLFVDDIRDAPKGWTLARTISESLELIRRYGGDLTHVSLDHDISIPVVVGEVQRPYPSPDTFKVVAYYLQEVMTRTDGNVSEDIILTTHSANPLGRKAIVDIFEDIGKKCTEVPS